MSSHLVKEILAKYGQTVVIRGTEADVSTRAFLQPVTDRKEREPFVMTELGSIDDRLWLYLGQTPLETEDIVEYNHLRFQPRSCRAYYIGDNVIYWWAMLEPEKEAAE
jgi:hypothetical protein